MNPELLTLDQEIPAGTVITTGASSAELIKVKVVRRDTETVAIRSTPRTPSPTSMISARS